MCHCLYYDTDQECIISHKYLISKSLVHVYLGCNSTTSYSIIIKTFYFLFQKMRNWLWILIFRVFIAPLVIAVCLVLLEVISGNVAGSVGAARQCFNLPD